MLSIDTFHNIPVEWTEVCGCGIKCENVCCVDLTGWKSHTPVPFVHYNTVPQGVCQQDELQQHSTACGSLQAGEGAAGGPLPQRQPKVTLAQRPLQLRPQESRQAKKHSLLWESRGKYVDMSPPMTAGGILDVRYSPVASTSISTRPPVVSLSTDSHSSTRK